MEIIDRTKMLGNFKAPILKSAIIIDPIRLKTQMKSDGINELRTFYYFNQPQPENGSSKKRLEAYFYAQLERRVFLAN